MMLMLMMMMMMMTMTMTQADSPSCPTKMYSTSPDDDGDENDDDDGGGKIILVMSEMQKVADLVYRWLCYFQLSPDNSVEDLVTDSLTTTHC